MSYPVPRPEGPSTAIRAQNLAITIPGRYGMVCSCNSYNYALAGALSQVQTKKDVCVNAPVPLITSSNGEYPLCLGKKRSEVDFVIESDAGGVMPIEAKSGRNVRAYAALNNLLATKEYAHDTRGFRMALPSP